MKNKLFAYSIFVLALLLPALLPAQTVTGRSGQGQPPPTLMRYEIVNGDTVYYTTLSNVKILELRTFSNKEDQKRYDKLVRSVRKTLPLAREAKKKLDYYEYLMAGQDKKDRKETLKRMEDQLTKEFGEDVRNLTKKDAAVLFKLIDRETDNTAYSLLKELKGGFNAFFYQIAAKSFKLDLKSDFNPETNIYDQYIEEIVQMLDSGRI
ncbi:MAG: DUF4294 domain-containing protein [Bacteroidia bacterium]|nr:DUF4294 domain-containing protein [Bacteroidia bacterium]